MDRLNQWLTLLANIGVIVGIVFLAFEIQQNTEMMKAQTRDSMAAKQMQIAEWVLTSEFEAGLYDEEEFEARHNTWESEISVPAISGL